MSLITDAGILACLALQSPVPGLIPGQGIRHHALRMQASPGQSIRPPCSRRGAGRYVRGDLRERPTASSVMLALCGVCGAVGGGILAGGLEGVLVGAGMLWMVASFGDVVAERIKVLAARRTSAADAQRREEWIARAVAAEDGLQVVMDQSPVRIEHLKRALMDAQEAGVEIRCSELVTRAAALLSLLERPLLYNAGEARTHSNQSYSV